MHAVDALKLSANDDAAAATPHSAPSRPLGVGRKRVNGGSSKRHLWGPVLHIHKNKMDQGIAACMCAADRWAWRGKGQHET